MTNKTLDILKQKQVKLCALATVSAEGKPDNAVMGYAVMDDLTIILSTRVSSKKWQNLKENKRVALVFGWSFDEPYIQCDGEATLIESGQEYQECGEFFFHANPLAEKFKSPETVFIKIKPTEMRLTDFHQQPGDEQKAV